jgi:hypothetical protein
VLKKTCRLKTEETTDGQRKLYNEEIHKLHSLINIIRMIRSWNMRWAKHMACMEENEMHTGYWGGGNGKLTHKLEDDIKIDCKEIVWNGVD